MDSTKVTVNLPDDQVAFLKKIAEQEKISITEVLQRSINSEKFFVDAEKAGHKVFVEDKQKQIRTVKRG